MVFLLIGILLFLIGVGVTFWYYLPRKKPGIYNFPVFMPVGAKEIEFRAVDYEVFEKMPLRQVSYTFFSDEEGAGICYQGTNDEVTYFDAEREFPAGRSLKSSAELKGNVLETTIKIDILGLMSSLFFNTIYCGAVVSVIVLILMFLFGCLDSPCPSYCR